VSEVTSESTQVTGTGEPGSTVKVELPDGTVLDGVTDDQGNYTFTVLPASAVPLTCGLSLVTSLTVGTTGGVISFTSTIAAVDL
ncbi:hypothetical protein BUZ01_15375, partial [Staphylococcus gallinarum]